jgi:HAD superfamily hydrolase (TIGR01509 family)
MLKALIFDFDGLILDTETPEYQAWQNLYQEHGQHLDLQTWGKIIGGYGLSNFQPLPHLETLLGQPLDHSALEARIRAEVHDIILKTSPREGVLATIEQAQRLGLKLAVASSSPHSWVDGHLTRLGLFQHFDAVICCDDVPPGRTKPHPDLFQLATQTLSAAPAEALVFEDSPNGVLAARRAGIPVIAIPNPITSQLTFEGENERLASMAEFNWQRWVDSKSDI